MKIGVVSDTHDNLVKVKEIVRCFNNEKVEMVLHAGDIVAPFILLKGFKDLNCPLTAVFGNNDGDKILLHKIAIDLNFSIFTAPKKIQIGNKNILMLHCPDELEAFVNSGQYDIIIYGHTHEVDMRKEKGVIILNPGEAGGWISNKYTIGIIDISNLKAKVIEM